MNYSNLRKINQTSKKKRTAALNADLDDWRHSPYTALKSRFFFEISTVIVYFLQFTPIKANWVTLLYAALGIISALLLGSGIDSVIIAGVVVIFFRNILDWIDGPLARIKKQSSNLGEILDDWCAIVGSFGFLVGLGMYLYNATQEIHFIYLILILITVRAIDLKDYAYHRTMYYFYKSNISTKKLRNKRKKNIQKGQNISSVLIKLKNFFQNFLDDRARTNDFICLVILVELNYNQIFLTNFIYYLIVFKYIMLFLGGFYLVYFQNLVEKLNSK